MRVLRYLVGLLLFVPLAGCFSLEGPIFSAADGVEVANVIGTYETTDGEEVMVAAPDDDYDYRLRVREGGDVQEAVLRFIRMGNYHLAQLHDGTGAEPGSLIFIVTVDAYGVKMHLPPQTDVAQLARQYRLQLTGANDLSGNEDVMPAFLEEVVAMNMVSDYVLLRKR
ncbi:MAG: hypothetical protein H6842_07150 [Rhodospirillaceae bacterium]|nr:hypothetical protein [Rhodospirillaceae bacterium]